MTYIVILLLLYSDIFIIAYYNSLGSGKTITAELAILRLQRESPGAKTIYVAPLKALARERLQDWQRKFGTGSGGGSGGSGGGKQGGSGGGNKGLGLHILELTGDVTPTMEELNRAGKVCFSAPYTSI